MKKLSVFLILLAGILWGIIGIFVRHFQALGIGSLELTLIRTFFSAVLFAIFILIYKPKLFKIKLRDIWIFFGTGLVSIAVFSYCYFKAIEFASLSVAAVLLYTAPAFVMIFSIFLFKEKISTYKIIALVLSFVGCLLVTGVITGNIQITFAGFIFGILSGICYALYSIFTRYALMRNYNPLTILIYTFIIGGVTLLFVAKPMQVVNLVKNDTSQIWWIVLFVLSSEVFPYLIYTIGLKYMKSSTASIIVSIEPVVATIVGAIVFNEAVQMPWGFLGIAFVMVSVVFANLSETIDRKREKKSMKTPIRKLSNIMKDENCLSNIYAKLENENLTGSIKYRTALYLINDAEEAGLIKAGGTVIEPTSGNTGIGLAAICKERGYTCKIVMPDSMSKGRIRMIEEQGGQVILTPGALGMAGSIEKAEELHKEIENSFVPSQFDNPSNTKSHYETTGPEIYEEMAHKIDIFVSAVGTGGTITGAGKFLKEKLKDVKVVAVEPLSSNILSGGQKGAHKIQGIGAGFIPKVLDTNIYDEVIAVSDDDAFKYNKMIKDLENIEVGYSSGAALCAAIELSKRKENQGKNIVVIFPDSFNRYID